jgi:hypothetical protein
MLPIFQRTVTNSSGDVLPGASVEVRRESDNALVQLYADRAGTVLLPNPTTADSDGFVQFFAASSNYKITATSGSGTVVWRYVDIGSSDVRLDLAAPTGAAMVGFLQAGTGAVSRTVQKKSEESLSILDFIAQAQHAAIIAGTSTYDATAEVQAAFDAAGAAGKPLEVIGFVRIRPEILLKYNGLSVWSKSQHKNGFDFIIKDLTAVDNYAGYFKKQNTATAISDVWFWQIGFRCNYNASAFTGKDPIAAIRIRSTGGVKDRNIGIYQCHFQNPQNDCLAISPNATSFCDGVAVINCTADVDDLAQSSRIANVLRTIIDYVASPSMATSYGTKNITNIRVHGGFARGVRTFADIKRGSNNYSVIGCVTEDMSDCHHSADGGSKGFLGGLVGRQKSALLPTKNYIELQGEDIILDGFTYDASSALGGIAGILVQDYADPAEGAGVAHQSKNVTVKNGVVDGVASHGVRLQNTKDCTVENITAKNCTLDAVAIEYIAGKTDPAVGALSPVGNVVDMVRLDSTVRHGVNAPTVGSGNRIGRVIGATSKKVEGANSATWEPLHGVDYAQQNMLMLMDAAGTLPVGFKRSSASVTITQETSDVPVEYGIAVTVNGADAAVLDSIEPFQRVLVSRGDVVQLDLFAKLNTATTCGVLLQEFNGATFLSSNFFALTASNSAWTRNTVRLVCQSAGVNQVRVQLLPNAASNNAAAVGISRFAGVRFGKCEV